MPALFQEVRQAFRSLLRRPSYLVVSVITLALGIGANTAIFSVAHAVLMRPLPYPDTERLVLIRTSFAGNRPMASVAGPMLVEFRQRARQIDAFEALWTGNFTLEGMGDPEQLRTAWPTAGLLGLLGFEPALGRTFTPEEMGPDGPQTVILSHELWQRRFGGEREILGREIQLSGGAWTVIGIMPPGQRLLLPGSINVARTVDAWLPLEAVNGAALADQNPEQLWLKVVGRLAPGATLAQAQAEMHAIGRQLQEDYEVYAGTELDFHVSALHEDLVSSVRVGLLALLGAVGFVLLIACANVASLALARAVDREREMALRLSLGASRVGLLRHSLLENLMLSCAGGLVGLALAAWGLELLLAFGPAQLPRMDEIAIDGTALLFTLGAVLMTGFLFGLAPAVRSFRAGPADSLRGAGSQGGGQRGRVVGRPGIRSVLVVSEIALAVVLLVGAGLMMRSFLRVAAVDPGFEATDRLVFDLTLPGSRYWYDEPEPEENRREAWGFHRELQERLEAVPGVEAVGAVSHLPLSGRSFTVEYWRNPDAADRDTAAVQERAVTPGYFEAMGIRRIAGRSFTEADGPDADVIVVDRTLADAVWPGETAVGKRLKLSLGTDEHWMEVVGVVEHVRHEQLTEKGIEHVYLPFRRFSFGRMAYVVSTAIEPMELAPAVRSTVTEMDPLLPVTGLRTMESVVAEATTFLRFPLLLMALFGATAVVLAVVGIYGTLSYVVAHRTREIGIRMAVGARAGEILSLVLRQGFVVSLAGVVLGLLAALLLSRFLDALLFDISAVDPVTYAAIGSGLLAVALLACLRPARRAASLDPAAILKE